MASTEKLLPIARMLIVLTSGSGVSGVSGVSGLSGVSGVSGAGFSCCSVFSLSDSGLPAGSSGLSVEHDAIIVMMHVQRMMKCLFIFLVLNFVVTIKLPGYDYVWYATFALMVEGLVVARIVEYTCRI